MRVHKLNNVEHAMELLEKQKVPLKSMTLTYSYLKFCMYYNRYHFKMCSTSKFVPCNVLQ